jgi:hypothetical protein
MAAPKAAKPAAKPTAMPTGGHGETPEGDG